jgi:hypothetical protein
LATTVKFNNNGSSTKRRTEYYNWDKDIFPSVKQRITALGGVKPTVRGLLYILESMNVLKKNDYNGLSKHLVQWRENGDLPLYCVADKTRHIIDIQQFEPKTNYSLSFIEEQGFGFSLALKNARIHAIFNEQLQTWDELITPKQHIQSAITYLSDVEYDLYNHIPRWLNQRNYVEVFVEKNAMGSSFKSILNAPPDPRQIIVVPNGGWSSYTFVMSNLDRLLYQQKNGKEVYVQYYGDSDPSGERMTAEDSKLVKKLKEHHINFERIAINEDTIEDFGLEEIKDKELDAETLDKLERNPNYDWFVQRHDGQVWQIELDALLLDLSKFKELVLSKVDKHFDTSIQKEAIEEFKRKYPISDIQRDLRKAVKDFNKLINPRGWNQ